MRWPAQVVFGRGTLARLGEHVTRFDIHRVLVVTDMGIRRAGLVDRLGEMLRGIGIDYIVFDDVHPDPPIDDVVTAARIALEGRIDTIIGLGGGSAMDTAKAVSALAVRGRCLEELYGHDRVPGPGLTKILMPTTGGSGSEISDSCNFSDHRAGDVKRILVSRHLLADLALVDPALTDHAPPLVTAESGIDALTHALEAFTCRTTNVLSDLWARQALVLAARSLIKAVEAGSRAPEARDDMSLAAMLGNAAADLAGLGAVHGLAHSLTAHFPISHGRANAILLPAVVAFNAEVMTERFTEIATIFGTLGRRTTPKGAADAGVAEIMSRLTSRIGLAADLRQFGVGVADLPVLGAEAVHHFPRHFGANSRAVSAEQAAAILHSVW